MEHDARLCVSDASLRCNQPDMQHGLSQSIVDTAIDKWCKRPQACVNEREGHLEHLGSSADWLCR